MYIKNPFEAKYQFHVDKRESVGLRYCNDSKPFIAYQSDMDNIHKLLINTVQKCKILIVFDDMITDIVMKTSTNSNESIYQK